MKTYRVTTTLRLVREIQSSEEYFAIQEGRDKMIEHFDAMEVIGSTAELIDDDGEDD